jgi:hypothetical protein
VNLAEYFEGQLLDYNCEVFSRNTDFFRVNYKCDEVIRINPAYKNIQSTYFNKESSEPTSFGPFPRSTLFLNTFYRTRLIFVDKNFIFWIFDATNYNEGKIKQRCKIPLD